MPRPSGVQVGRNGESPKERRDSVPLASTAQRSDSVEVPSATAMRLASVLRRISRNRRGVSTARVKRPSKPTHER
jgi:hypothetical protein